MSVLGAKKPVMAKLDSVKFNDERWFVSAMFEEFNETHMTTMTFAELVEKMEAFDENYTRRFV